MTNQLQTIAEMEEHIGYQTGCTLTGINFSKVNDGWRIILKVISRDGKPLVSFTHAPTIDQGLSLIHSCINTTAVTLKWKDDVWFEGRQRP